MAVISLQIEVDEKGAVKGIEGFSNELEKMKNKSDAVSKELKKQFKDLGDTITKALKVATAAIAGLGTSLFAMVQSTAKAGDEIAKMSKRLNISTEALSALSFQAGLAGTDFRATTTAIRFMTKAMFDSTQGLETAQRGFDILGISVTKTDGKLKDAEDIFLEISDALAEMENGTEKTAAAQLLFGSRMGTALIPLLNQGSKALREQADEARKLGIIFDEEAAKKSEDFVDSMLRLKSSLTGLRNEISFTLLPAVEQYVKQIKEWILQNKELIKQNVQITIKLIAEALISLRDGAVAIAEFVKENNELIKTLSSMAVGFAAVSLAISIATGNIPGLLASIALLKGAFAGLGLALVAEKLQELSGQLGKTTKDIGLVSTHSVTLSKDMGVVSTRSTTANKAFARMKDIIKAFPELFAKAGDESKKATDKIAKTWEQTSDKVKTAFEKLGIIPKEQLADQVKSFRDAFKTITEAQNLSQEEVVRLREGLFAKLKQLSETSDKDIIALGFNPKDFRLKIEEMHQNLLNRTTETTTFIRKNFDTVSIGATTQVASTKTLISATLSALDNLTTQITDKQLKSFGSLKDEIESYKNAYITVEEEITDIIAEEVEEREEILTRFFVNTEGQLARLKEGFAGLGGVSFGASSFESELTPQANNTNTSTQTNTFNFNGRESPNNFESRQSITRAVNKANRLNANTSF